MKIAQAALNKIKANKPKKAEKSAPDMDKAYDKIERMFEELKRKCGVRIDEYLNAVIEKRMQEFEQGTRSLVGKEFKKYFDQSLNAWLSEKFEVTHMSYNTPFKDIRSLVDAGWRVLDLDKNNGLIMQRRRGKNTGKPEVLPPCQKNDQSKSVTRPQAAPAATRKLLKIGTKKVSVSAPTATARGLRVKTSA